ncbi:CoA transferase [Blastococcus sp. VKM Ac-2987]|uniref:CoA transferase n=1 Tax=Blastococcus sp. VKM Ac-2987 TaxID=3004141 RepID=UPI0022AB5700|nr:CoA transferase [Blastococcus sp. VKM Ac-2987]MCZ2857844.1 CoA transferase [Blastococcus sp. VKM Ac-2987]
MTGPTADPAPASGRPLADLSVVEFSSFVAGPSAGMTLAQLGAQVVRVDPLGGGNDHHRWPVAPDGASIYWASLNKGKRSVTVDVRSEAGRELVAALATAGSGVFLDNAVGQRWLSYEALSARRADLVHVRVQGHRDGRPAVDYTVNAEVGVPQMTGPESMDAPVNHVLPAWDLLTGATAVAGLLSALHERSVTGRGAHVQIALADVALAGVANLGWLADAELSGRDRSRLGNHVYGSFGADFATSDGQRLMVVALTEKQWRALCRVTATEDVFRALERALDTDLDSESERYRLRETIAAVLRPWFAARPLDELAEQLDVARVLWSPYRTVRQAAARYAPDQDPVVRHVDQPGIGRMLAAASPLRWPDGGLPPQPAPRLGADTAEVLTALLGLTDAELGRLHEQQVIRLVDA